MDPAVTVSSPHVSSQRWHSDARSISMTEPASEENQDIADDLEGGAVSANIFSQPTVNGTSDVQTTNDTKTDTVYPTSPPVPDGRPKRRLKYGDMLDFSLEQREDTSWQQYHTRTGWMTGYWKQRQRSAQNTSSHAPPPPWKPAFSPNSFHLDSPPTLCASSAEHMGPSMRHAAKHRRCGGSSRIARLCGSNKIEHNSIKESHGGPMFQKGNLSTVNSLRESSANIADDRESTVHAEKQGADRKLEDNSTSGLSDHHIGTRDVHVPTGTSCVTKKDMVKDVKDGATVQGCELVGPSSTCGQSGRSTLAEAEECSHQALSARRR